MSVSGLGGNGAAYLSQSLQALLAQLSSVSPTSNASSSAPATSAAPAANSSTSISTSNQLSGSPTGALSAEIIQILLQMQMQTQQQQPATTPPPASSASISATSSQDPLQKLFSAMDGNGDGTVSETEMESFIQKQGGTQSQADQLFSSLTQNGSSSLTQNQLAQDLEQSQSMQAMGGHHHHHHGGEGEMPPTPDEMGSQLVQAIGGSGSTSVNQSQFESFVQSQGGTKSEADTDFAGINSSGSGSINATQFADAISAFQNTIQSGATVTNSANGNPILTALDGSAAAEQANVKPAAS